MKDTVSGNHFIIYPQVTLQKKEISLKKYLWLITDYMHYNSELNSLLTNKTCREYQSIF